MKTDTAGSDDLLTREVPQLESLRMRLVVDEESRGRTRIQLRKSRGGHSIPSL